MVNVNDTAAAQETFSPMLNVTPDSDVRMYGKPGLLVRGWNKDSAARAERLQQAYGDRR